MTLGEVAGKRKYQRASRIRQLARQNFVASGVKKECAICGYSNHIEICHVKSIKNFSDSSFVTEINDPKNLLPLCPNHHWEFDNGLLSNIQLPLVRLERT